MPKYITESEEQTIAFAKELASLLKPGMTLLLEGDLGAGKTTFTKGIGAGLNVKRMIKSPSYTIIREYQEGTMPLYHIDLYRLSEGEVFDLGLEEYFDQDGIVVVEWPSVSYEDMPREHLSIELETDVEHPEKRIIHLDAVGEKYRTIPGKIHFK